MQAAIARGEGDLGRGGAFLVSTGRHTGRSPKDKFVVREPSVEPHVWWENNAPMAPDAFAALLADMRAHIRGSELFVQDLYAGADPAYRLNVRVVTELAWHGLFIRHLLRRPERDGARRLRARLHHPELPALPRRPGPARLPLRDRHRHLLRAEAGADRRHRLRRREQEVGLHRSSTTCCPTQGVMPMHCSANHAQGDPDDVAVFFGLSGTGKTTLSADPARVLIGDDEHGWSDDGTFNFEGGCYAKTINLSPERRARDLRHHHAASAPSSRTWSGTR